MNVTQFPTTHKEKIGPKYCMQQAGRALAALHGEFPAELVHDLRVALRRSVAIADRMRELDPQNDWGPMRKKARRLFSVLGATRDPQVLSEWIKKLDPSAAHSAGVLLSKLHESEKDERSTAQHEIEKFDRKEWRRWSREFAARFRRVAVDRGVCECLAVEALEALQHRHRLALKNPSPFAFHRLRAEVKTFRYTIESFLPNLYPTWVPDLKLLQDLLGEVHDLDVLSETIVKKGSLDDTTHRWWQETLDRERTTRITQYRQKMAEGNSPLANWREMLPRGREQRAAGLARLSAWASFLTKDFARIRRTTKFALQLYDGSSSCGLTAQSIDDRHLLHAAALLRNVGRSKKVEAYHKASYRMIRRLTPPVGWTKHDIVLVATIARFHRRALPRADHKVLRDYAPTLRHRLLFQIACLRLATAFGAKRYQAVRRLTVERFDSFVVVRADGYTEGDRLTTKLSIALHLLESICLQPVRILPRDASVPEPIGLLPPVSNFGTTS